MNSPLYQLLDISREWTTLPRTADVANAAICFLRSTFHVDAGLVSYNRHPLTERADYLRIPKQWFSSWGFATPEKDLRRAIDASLHFYDVVQRRQWFPAEDLPSAWTEITRQNGIRQVGLWTIQMQRVPVGLFALARTSFFHDDDSLVISRCMAHISTVLEMVITRRMAEELSIRDPLTGAFNRRGLLAEFEKLTSDGRPLTLAVIDLDDFKRFNDTYGHTIGDRQLITVTEALAHYVNTYGGICARIGGDEFVLLTPCCAADAGQCAVDDDQRPVNDARRTAQAIGQWLANAGIRASVGCSVFGVDGLDFDVCYRLADERLYCMKAQTEAR